MPGVSVVIPCFNGKLLLEKYLPGLLKQLRSSEDEVIIVDDCSTDDTVLFLKQAYPMLKLIESNKNRGFAHTANTGFRAAQHGYVCLLNSDAAPEEGFLPPLLEHFRDDDVFSVSSLELNLPAYQPVPYSVSVDFKFGIFWYKYETSSAPLDDAVPLLFCFGACTVYDKKKFFALGGFDTMLSPFYWEDMDICFRAYKRGWRCLCEFRSRHRHEHQASISKKHSRFFIQTIHWKNRFLFTWKNIRSFRLIIQHLVFLIPELVLLPLMGKPEFSIGFFKALSQFPEAMRQRRNLTKNDIYTDREIISRFKYVKK